MQYEKSVSLLHRYVMGLSLNEVALLQPICIFLVTLQTKCLNNFRIFLKEIGIYTMKRLQYVLNFVAFGLLVFCMSCKKEKMFTDRVIDKKNGKDFIAQQTQAELESFWDKHAQALPWFSTWNKVLDWNLPFARWFVDGRINASYACLDVHVKNERKDKVALYWSDEKGNERILTYQELYTLTNKMASVLQSLGVQKGDIVVLYLPLIPEAVAAMLAVARLGATHSVVFSGFSAQSLQDRINDAQATHVITADIGQRRGSFIHLKDLVDRALVNTPSIKKVLVVKRSEQRINMQHDRDVFLHDMMDSAADYVQPESVESNHPLFMLYTSGTTGKPKGIVHSTGGYLTYIYWTFKWAFNPHEKSVYWCTADIGWITGHSYVVYAPLMHGMSIVINEGAPDYPAPDAWWNIIEKYNVSIFYTSPTALRMFMRYGNEHIDKHAMPSLKVLGTVGEPINPEVWHWYHDTIGKKRCPVIDTWWQTETGGFMIAPTLGREHDVLPKAGSATLPLPTIQAVVLDQEGKEVESGAKGYLAIKNPWPGMMLGIFNDPERYKQVYWSKFPGMYYPGDFAIKDEDGYFWLLGRADEVLNIAGHRVGTAEVESATVCHPDVAEAATIGVADEIKGESIVIFAILKAGTDLRESLKKEIIQVVRDQIGTFVTPRDVFIVQKLPKTRSGKIMRRVLKAVVEGLSVGDITTLEDEASVDEIREAMQSISTAVPASVN